MSTGTVSLHGRESSGQESEAGTFVHKLPFRRTAQRLAPEPNPQVDNICRPGLRRRAPMAAHYTVMRRKDCRSMMPASLIIKTESRR